MRKIIPCLIILIVCFPGCTPPPTPVEIPNILWIVVEDMSCDFHYQGNNLVITPNVDMLAKEGNEENS